MIDNLIKKIKEEKDFNNLGYRLSSVEVRVNDIEQKYYITVVKESDLIQITYYFSSEISTAFHLLLFYSLSFYS